MFAMIRFSALFLIISFLRCYFTQSVTPQTTRWEPTKWITLNGLGLTDDNLPGNWTPKTSHELLLKELSKKKMGELFFILRGEFYTMALGDEFYHLYEDENISEDYHAIVNATMKLWLKLSTMSKIEPIIKNSIFKAVQHVVSTQTIRKSMTIIFENIEELMKKDPTLYNEYLRIKTEFKNHETAHDHKIYYYEIPKTEEEAMKIVGKALNNPLTKKYMVNAVFLNQTEQKPSVYSEAFIFAKSILELSKQVETEELVQRLYDEAIAEVAENLENVNLKDAHPNLKTLTTSTFNKLTEKFKNNPELNSVLEAKKKEVASSRNND